MSVPVALVGCGAWGTNLLRVLVESERAELVAVADVNPARREVALAKAPGVPFVSTLEEAIALGAKAVVIATPPRTHASLVTMALEAGLDVLVEKPLAVTAADAERCATLARALGRVAMVGHLLRYHPAIERMIEMAREGALGQLDELTTLRLSVRGDRSVPALWSLGPHDLSILHALAPLSVEGLDVDSGPGGDPVVLFLRLRSGLSAMIKLSRVHATKERKVCLVGTSRMAVIDDVRAPDTISLHKIGAGSSLRDKVEEVIVPWREPLAVEVDHFLRCVETRETPRTSFEEGAAVVRVLALASHAREDSRSTVISGGEPSLTGGPVVPRPGLT